MHERPSAEETIALLRATIEATHDAILVVGLDRRVLLYNRHYLKTFGLSPEVIERDGMDGIIAALAPQIEDVEPLLEMSRRMFALPDGEILDVVRFKDGRVFERYIAPHRIGDDVIGFVASFHDIGMSVRTAEALEQHRAFLETAQEVAHIGSWVAEFDGSDHLGWSAETHRIFGVPLGQFDGSSATFYAFVHPDDRETVRAASESARAGGDRSYEAEHRIVRRDNSVRWVHERARIVRDAQGRVLRMIGTVQDVTDRRQLEDQLRQAQKMEAIGRLAGGIAHDLNNALTAIAGYAELALGEMQPEHAARTDIEEIRRATERAASVTRQLLAFSRKQVLEPRQFDLNGTVASLSRMLARLLGPDINVQAIVADELPPILGDPSQVEQAVINLAVNAKDAMPSGGRLELATSVEAIDEAASHAHAPMPPGTYVLLRISDSGLGMSADTRAHIFEPFFTTKDVGKGTGLGLSMVYSMLKQMNGFIFVDSQPGRGTTFRLYFPPAKVKATGKSADTSPVVAEADGGRHQTLMIVEDEPAVRNLVATTLRHDGYHLLVATSAEEALRIADAHEGPLDLLLTDAVMPGRSGIELANAMVARRPGLPVIVMSGYTEETIPGTLDDPIALLQKPFSPRELRQRIRERLNRS